MGKPTIRFDGVDDILEGAEVVSGAFSLFAVVIPRATPPAYGALLASNNVWMIAALSGGAWGTFETVDQPSGTTLVTGTPYVLAMIWNGSAGAFRTNLVSDGTFLHLDNGIPALGIGGQPGSGTRYSQVDMCEVIAYDSALSNGDRDSVEGYLNTKYFGSPATVKPYWLYASQSVIGGPG